MNFKRFHGKYSTVILPAQYTKNQIQHEKWSDHNQRNEIEPVVSGAKRIIRLEKVTKTRQTE